MAKRPDRESLPYRDCAAAAVFNREGKVFIGRRMAEPDDDRSEVEAPWQMPQGGIDPGEDALTAAIREVGEETGIAPEHLQLIAEAPEELQYDLPDDLIGKIWKGKWRGQRQRWFLFAFTGEDADVNIATAHPEFRAWKWAEPSHLPDMIVPFKRQLYRDVLEEFAPYLG